MWQIWVAINTWQTSYCLSLFITQTDITWVVSAPLWPVPCHGCLFFCCTYHILTKISLVFMSIIHCHLSHWNLTSKTGVLGHSIQPCIPNSLCTNLEQCWCRDLKSWANESVHSRKCVNRWRSSKEYHLLSNKCVGVCTLFMRKKWPLKDVPTWEECTKIKTK